MLVHGGADVAVLLNRCCTPKRRACTGARDRWRIQVPADRINLEFVMGNKVMVGTVNANREYFEQAVVDLSQAELEYPGWLSRLFGRRG